MGLAIDGGPNNTLRVGSLDHRLEVCVSPSYPLATEGETEGMAEAKRTLLAILAADVVGYSRLMGDDERATMEMLNVCRDVFRKRISDHSGRVVDTAGDSVLATFPSVVEAVDCAVDVQSELVGCNADLSENRRMLFRIGVNLGDVLKQEDGTIYGDGVNVAARLEGLAEPSGIAVSEDAYCQVEGKTEFGFEDIGEHEVKNIVRPVRTYRVNAEAPAGASPIVEKPLPLPDKPSLAVLPFDNLSGDPHQEYFADGLVEDIITTLSKVSGLFVIARNSTFAYKGKSPDIRQAARELGVKNVLEGSVRKSGDRVRITAQLIEATSGGHLWAEKYDRKLIDIFDLQDEITNEVATALQVRLTEGEQVRIRRRQTTDIAAWEYFARGQSHFRSFNKQDNATALELLQQSIEIDPDFAAAWSLLAWVHWADGRFGWSRSMAQSIERAAACVARSLERDDTQPDAYAVKGGICLHQRQYDEAVRAGRTAVDMAPNIADSYLILAHTLNYIGHAEEALGLVEQAMRLSPFFPDYYLGVIALSYRLVGRYEDSIANDKKRLACQRRSKISPPGRSKTSPLNVMRYAVLGGCPGSP